MTRGAARLVLGLGLAAALVGAARAQPAGGDAGPGGAGAAPKPGSAGGAPKPGSAGGAGAARGQEPLSVPAPVEEAEPPTVSVSLSGPEVVLGATFYLFVRAVYQPGVAVNLPASLPLGAAFDETARTDSTRVNPDGTITRDFEVAVMAFEVGDLMVPPIPVTYAAHGRARDVMTDPVAIRVRSFIGEGEAVLRDIAGPVGVERRDLTLIYIAAGAVAVIAALIALLLLRRRWSRRRRAVLARLPEAVQRSAHDEALARLDELEGNGALDLEDLKSAYLQMSEILRNYIGRRFGFPALDLTTVEIQRELEIRPSGPFAAELVAGWLERADLVKFAGHAASADDARQAFYDARIFIDRTRAGAAETGAPPAEPPAPEPPPPAAKESA